MFRAIVCAVLLLAPSVARAQGQACALPKDGKDARPLAREWFARALKAQEIGDDAEAVRAYDCSMRIYPHAFTAYNLAKAAEKTGDLPLAIEYYKRYLEMAANPKDKDDVEQTISLLKERLAKVKAEMARKPDAAASTAQAPVPPPARAVTQRPIAPPPAGPRYRPAAWTAVALATVALGAGLALNLKARSKVDDCHARFAKGDPKYGDSCDAASPLATSSYALFGVGGLAAIAAVGLFIAGAPDGPEIGFAPEPGGLRIAWSRRF